jgi:hypothetical protein
MADLNRKISPPQLSCRQFLLDASCATHKKAWMCCDGPTELLDMTNKLGNKAGTREAASN